MHSSWHEEYERPLGAPNGTGVQVRSQHAQPRPSRREEDKTRRALTAPPCQLSRKTDSPVLGRFPGSWEHIARCGSRWSVLGSWGNTMRDAGWNKERWKRRRTPTQYPSTDPATAAPLAALRGSIAAYRRGLAAPPSPRRLRRRPRCRVPVRRRPPFSSSPRHRLASSAVWCFVSTRILGYSHTVRGLT